MAQHRESELGHEGTVVLTQLRVVAEEQTQRDVSRAGQTEYHLQRGDRRFQPPAGELGTYLYVPHVWRSGSGHGVRLTLSTTESKAVPSFSVRRTRAGSRC